MLNSVWNKLYAYSMLKAEELSFHDNTDTIPLDIPFCYKFLNSFVLNNLIMAKVLITCKKYQCYWKKMLFYCRHCGDSTLFLKYKLLKHWDYTSFSGWNDCILAESEPQGPQEKGKNAISLWSALHWSGT